MDDVPDNLESTYGLRRIELSDQPVFDQAFALAKEPLSDYTFANTFIWSKSLGFYWTQLEGHLCIFAVGSGDLTMACPPMGEGDLRRCLKACFEIMDDYNSRVAHRSHSRIEYVSQEFLPRLSSLGLVATPMGGDYIYDTKKMIDLSGGELKSKRHARNRFARDYAALTKPLCAADVPACKQLLSLWQQQGEEKTTDDPWQKEASVLRRLDTQATELALDSFEQLGLTGMTLWVDNRLVGFTLGQALTPLQASILIEKTDRNLPGSAQFIFSEFCRQYWASFPECNVGDDWGIPSLRWTKESYRPVRILPKFVLTYTPTPLVGWRPTVPLPVPNPPHLASPAREDAPPPQVPVTIESAELSDLNALVELERKVFSADEAFNRKQLRYLLRSPRSVIFTAKHGERVVGWCIALLRRHTRYRTARLYSLAVDPEYRGRGIGERLVLRLLQHLEELRVYRCFLEVREDNERARQLYRRLGFVDVAVLPHYYGQNQHGRRMLRLAHIEEPPQGILPRPLGLA